MRGSKTRKTSPPCSFSKFSKICHCSKNKKNKKFLFFQNFQEIPRTKRRTKPSIKRRKIIFQCNTVELSRKRSLQGRGRRPGWLPLTCAAYRLSEHLAAGKYRKKRKKKTENPGNLKPNTKNSKQIEILEMPTEILEDQGKSRES